MRRKAIGKLKLQSAMEYLMTYGWAILIIAVVLGALYQIGAFSSSSLTVRAPPGACKVLRTSASVNLVGQCSGLLPKYVAQFNGQSYVAFSSSSTSLSGLSAFSISTWMMAGTISGLQELVGRHNDCTNAQGTVRLNSNKVQLLLTTTTGCASPSSSASLVSGMWYNVVETYNGVQLTTYINGVFDNGVADTGSVTANSVAMAIGAGSWTSSEQFSGDIADVQIYNSSLDASSVATLYQEGLGGAPIVPGNIVDWWPLNGDANDYGGKNNNGASTAITYVSQYGK
jgi:hypothetical protein